MSDLPTVELRKDQMNLELTSSLNRRQAIQATVAAFAGAAFVASPLPARASALTSVDPSNYMALRRAAAKTIQWYYAPTPHGPLTGTIRERFEDLAEVVRIGIEIMRHQNTTVLCCPETAMIFYPSSFSPKHLLGEKVRFFRMFSAPRKEFLVTDLGNPQAGFVVELKHFVGRRDW